MDQQLIIAGFHRSGTSFVTQVLAAAGLFVGDELLGAKPSNPYGHYEDVVPLRIHERILRDNGTTWRVAEPRPFRISSARWREMERYVAQRGRGHRIWGFKDPRVCHFLGAWKHLMPSAKVLMVFRDYAASVHSLHRRHARNLLQGEGKPALHRPFFEEPDHALRLWMSHNRAMLAFRQAFPDDCLVLPIEAIQRGFPLVREMRRRFQLDLDDVSVLDHFDPSVTTSDVPPASVSSVELGRRAERLYEALWAAAPQEVRR